MSAEVTDGEVIRLLARRRRWTQAQTAAALGVSRNTVNRYGMDGPNGTTPSEPVLKLARAYLRDDTLQPADLNRVGTDEEVPNG